MAVRKVALIVFYDKNNRILLQDRKKISKRGKMSGAKKVIRCQNCFSDKIVLEDRKASDYRCVKCNSNYKDIFIDAVKEGEILYDFPQASDIRKNAIGQFEFLEL